MRATLASVNLGARINCPFQVNLTKWVRAYRIPPVEARNHHACVYCTHSARTLPARVDTKKDKIFNMEMVTVIGKKIDFDMGRETVTTFRVRFRYHLAENDYRY